MTNEPHGILERTIYDVERNKKQRKPRLKHEKQSAYNSQENTKKGIERWNIH